MSEEKQNKSGVGKFFLGAALGAALGAIASKFVKIETDDGEEIDEPQCDCGDKCDCKKQSATSKKTSEKDAK